MNSSTGLRVLAELINDTTTRTLPKEAVLYGCPECEVMWIDEPDCWQCGDDGTIIAHPFEKDGLKLEVPADGTIFSGTHFVPDPTIAEHMKRRYS